MRRPPISSFVQVLLLSAAVAARVAVSAQPAATPANEPDPALTAAGLLGATPLAGADYTIDPAVRTPGTWHVFSITSPFGRYTTIRL